MAAPNSTTATWQRYFFFYGTICLVVASLYFARIVILPIVLSILIAFVLSPMAAYMQRHGIHRIIAVTLVVTFASLTVLGIVGVVFYQAKELAQEIPQYKGNIDEKIASLREMSEGKWLEEFWDTVADVSKSIEGDSKKMEKAAPVPVTIEKSNIPLFTNAALYTMDFLVNAGLVLLLVIFILLGREDLRNRIIGMCGNCNLMSTTKALDEASRRVSRFLSMQLFVNATYGLTLGIGLVVIGVPFAVVWGFLAALLRYIPYLGPWVAAIFPMTIAFAVLPGWGPLIAVFALILVLELISNNFMEPWLYGRSIGVSEIALIVSAVFWAWLWGPLGLILATPITACLVVFGRYVRSLHFVPHFMGIEPVLSTEVTFYQRLLAKDVDEASDIVEAFVQETPVEKVYDEVLLPALIQAKRNYEQGDIQREDRKYVMTGIRQVVDEVVEPAMDESHEQHSETDPVPSASRRVRTLGLAWDPSGEAGLGMLKSMCDLAKSEWRIFSIQGGWAEAVDQVRREKPAILHLGTLATKRWGRIRSFCRRIKSHFPDLVILVHIWGQEDGAGLRSQLQETGAAELATTFLESWELFKAHQSRIAETMQAKGTPKKGASSNGAKIPAAASR